MTKPIFLIGMMGVGKTTIGKALGNALEKPFVDLDDLFVKKHSMTINEYFNRFGEVCFRREETLILKTSLLNGKIVATGGGLPLKKENQEILKSKGEVIYLKAKEETILSNLKGQYDQRPMLKNNNVEKLLMQRDPCYLDSADVVIEVDHLSVDEIIRKIISIISMKH